MRDLVLHEVRAGLVVAVVIFAFLGLATLLRRRGVEVELTRKLAHVGAGLTAACFPWIFREPLTVALLCAGFGVIMVAGKVFGLLEAVHGVERRSVGAYAFPAVVVLTFWVAHERPLLYQIPILVLALSDSLAAIIGKGYGHIVFKARSSTRTLEGSTAFFLSTFLVVHIPVLLSGTTGRLESLLIATCAALVLTGVEAVCILGMDNLALPLMGWFVLSHLVGKEARELGLDLAVLLTCAGVAAAAVQARLLRATGAIAGVLGTYTAWMLGGALGIAPIPAGVIALFALRRRTAEIETRIVPLELANVIQLSVPGLVLLLARERLGAEVLAVPYLATVTTAFAIPITRELDRRFGGSHERLEPRALGTVGALAFGLVAPLVARVFAGPALVPFGLGLGVAISVGAGIVFFRTVQSHVALFACPVCAAVSERSLHCDVPSVLRSGRRFWTANRALMASSLLGMAVAVVWQRLRTGF
jgi:phytol kinase